MKWEGAKHHPDDKDDGWRMHHRSSFKAFLEFVKRRSLPWENVEMDVIHSLQLILCGSFQDIDDGDTKTMVHARLNDLKLQGIDELSSMANEYACYSEWNAAMEKLIGWTIDEVISKLLLGEVFGGCCRLKGQDAMTKFTIMLHAAIDGKDTKKFPFAFFDRQGKYVETLLTANKRTDVDGRITGAFCFVQIASSELRQALEIQRQQEKKCFARLNKLAYIRQEMKNPLHGITFTRKHLEETDLSDDQRKFIETSVVCER